MVILVEDLKNACNKALKAVDSNTLSTVTETLELTTQGNDLNLNITNKEYYLRVIVPTDSDVSLHASVNANSFLKLITQTTTEMVELDVVDNNLVVKGNGVYKIPLIYDGEELLKLPEIKLNNITHEFNISTDILRSMLNYNSKELTKGFVTNPVQKLYYMDSKGAITFTSSACVNSFMLPEDVKLLFNSRLVKLFTLFDTDTVAFSLSEEPNEDGTTTTKVMFSGDSMELSAILSSNESLISSVPVEAIRNRSNENYPYTVSVSRSELLQTINRLSLFTSKTGDYDICYCTFKFGKDSVSIEGNDGGVKEKLTYKDDNVIDELENTYDALFDINDIKSVTEMFNAPYINISFGNEQAIVVSCGNIKNIIPQCEE